MPTAPAIPADAPAPEVWHLTLLLRFYNGRLQQEWKSARGNVEWRSVPEVFGAG